jgi:hypothetical protein
VSTHRKPVALGFEPECAVLPIASILPLKALRPTTKQSHKYRQIAASIRSVGVIEPPAVAHDPKQPGVYLLVDGHVRIEVLKDLGRTEVECLIATDDEAFTYNKRISRLAAVQENKMIVRAIERGVREQRIAEALALDVKTIERRFRLLRGICDEAAEILKDKPCPMAVFEIIKKMMPLRQVETAEMMVNSNNYTVFYAKALLAGTPQAQLVDGQRPKKVKGLTPEQIARMEHEIASTQSALKAIEQSYGTDNLNLVVVKGYLAKLLANGRVVRYLLQIRPEFLNEFQNIADVTSTRPKDAA